jgi:hypothetical protein
MSDLLERAINGDNGDRFAKRRSSALVAPRIGGTDLGKVSLSVALF